MPCMIDEFIDISHILIDDLRMCQAQLNQCANEQLALLKAGKSEEASACEEREQFWRRAFARAFFAYVEGNIYQMKQIAYSMRNEPGISFSEGELVMMCEETYELRENGAIRQTKAKLRFEPNFRFAFKMYSQAIGKPINVNYGTDGWSSLKSSIDVRDRLMHPKRATKMLVTRDESMSITVASMWFGELIEQVWDTTTEQAPHLPDWLVKL